MVKTWWDEREWGFRISLNAIIDTLPCFISAQPIVFYFCEPFKRCDTGYWLNRSFVKYKYLQVNMEQSQALA